MTCHLIPQCLAHVLLSNGNLLVSSDWSTPGHSNVQFKGLLTWNHFLSLRCGLDANFPFPARSVFPLFYPVLHVQCMKYSRALNYTGLNCMGPFIWSYFSIVDTTVLHDPQLVESTDVEPRLSEAPCTWRANYKLYADFQMFDHLMGQRP